MNAEKFLKTGWIVCLLAAFCNLLWGSAFPMVKSGLTLLQIDSAQIPAQILFAGCRFFLAGALVILFHSLTTGRLALPERGELKYILPMGLVQTIIQYTFFYVGIANTTGTKSAILSATGAFFGILITCLIFRMETLTTGKLLGCALGFAGVVLLKLGEGGGDLSLNLLGDGCVILSALTNGFVSVMIKKFSQHMSAVVLTGYQFMLGGAVMAVGGWLLGGRIGSVNLPGIGVLLYLALLSALAYTLWGLLLKHNPISSVTIFSFTKPVFGVILSVLILREGGVFGVRSLIALALVCAGIIVVNRDRHKARKT